MLVGDISTFAIESELSVFDARVSIRGIGYFVIYINGQQFGVKRPDATALANSFDTVIERINDKGRHTFSLFDEVDATEIVTAVFSSIYGETGGVFFGLNDEKLQELIFAQKVLWAPDGDAAFDDGSHVLQIDKPNDQVRLIGFINSFDTNALERSITECQIPAAVYYNILTEWSEQFVAQWNRSSKNVEFGSIDEFNSPAMPKLS